MLISFAVNCEADLRLCFRIGKIRFSHDAAQITLAILAKTKIGIFHLNVLYAIHMLKMLLYLITANSEFTKI